MNQDLAFIHRGWKAQDLLRREDILNILTSILKVSSHPLPQGMGGQLFCVDGIAGCCDAIMDLMETRALNKQKKEEGENKSKDK